METIKRELDGEKPPAFYVASRASVPARGVMWRGLRACGWRITSSWIDEDGEGQTGYYGELWGRIVSEIVNSEALILYAETEDFPLRGALVEVGIAIGLGKTVFACLPRVTIDGPTARPVGSWIFHPLVKRIESLEELRTWK